MQLNRLLLQFLALLFGVLAVYGERSLAEPLTDGDDFYVFAQPNFYADNEMAYADSRAKRYASSLRFGKRASKGWSSAVRFG